MTEPLDTRSPSLTLTSLMVPAAGEGTSTVALSDSSVTSGLGDDVARLDQDLDDRDVLEVPDVGDRDLAGGHGYSMTRRMSAITCAR